MNKLTLILMAMFAFISVNTFASGNASSGKLKAVTCIGCHGATGNSMVAIFPKLAGQGEGYLFKQLQDFKSGARKDGAMAGMVALLSQQDMANIAAYYAAQKITQGVAKKDAAMIKLGQKIYRGGKLETKTTACIACHGPKGAGIPSANFPALASQHSAYIVQQLIAFRQNAFNAQTGANTPSRTNDYAHMMQDATKDLTNAEIKAVAEYISGLH